MSDDEWTTVNSKKHAPPKNERNQTVMQNWEPVVLKNVKKTNVATTKPNISQQEIINRKLENDEPIKVKSLSNESRQELIKARVAKNMNQDKVAQALAIQSNIYKNIENGKTIPPPGLLSKINNLLGTKVKLT
jgi:ribosome-binding protein aMBF1 (putative translation factor)